MIANIQLLRGIAAVAVAAYHFQQHYAYVGGTWLFSPFIYGWAGVDLFFVISGYVIWHTTQEQAGTADALRFLYRRMVRIFLGYWPWLLVTGLMIWIFAPKIFLSKYDLLRSFLLLPQAHSTNLLSVSWTLTFELLFYAGFACLLLLPRRWWAPLLVCIAAIIAVAGTSRSFFLSPLILEFLAGVLLAAIVHRFGAPLPFLGIVIAILFGWIGIEVTAPGERMVRVLTFGVAALGLVYAAVGYERAGHAAAGLFVALGDASYTIYLCHVPILILVRWTIRDQLSLAPEIAYGALLLATLTFSLWWYRSVELPVYLRATAFIHSIKLKASHGAPGSAIVEVKSIGRGVVDN